MTVKLTKICSVVEVEDAAFIAFPPEVVGSIRPGSLDHLIRVKDIEWGLSMTDPIEPGTIPKCCGYLLLPASYKHPADSIRLTDVHIYVHHTNVSYGPSDRKFYIWREPTEPEPTLSQCHEYLGRGGCWYASEVFKGVSVIQVKKVPDAVPKPQPTPTTTLEEKIDRQQTDLELIKDRITAAREFAAVNRAGVVRFEAKTTASLESFEAKTNSIRELFESHRAEVIRSDAQAAANLASIKDSITALGDRLEQLLKVLSP